MFIKKAGPFLALPLEAKGEKIQAPYSLPCLVIHLTDQAWC